MIDNSIDSGATSAGGASGGGGDEISLSMPRKNPHETYLIKTMLTLAKFDQIIFTMSTTTDPRIVPYTRNCLNLVLDDNIKKNLNEALNEALTYIKNTNLDPSEQGSLQIEVCQKAIGEVYSYLDEFIGLAKTNAVVPIASDPTDAEVAAAMDILRAGGDIEVGGEEMTDPDRIVTDTDATAGHGEDK